MTVDRWLKNFSPEYRRLSSSERMAIRDFAILWSFFEGGCLGTHASYQTIKRAVDYWCEIGLVRPKLFEKSAVYFRDRYYSGGHPTDKFRGLRLGHGSQNVRDHIVSVFENRDATLEDETLMVFLVIYRFRNNLFHGVKGIYGFADQLPNFRIANGVLKQALKIGRDAPPPEVAQNQD